MASHVKPQVQKQRDQLRDNLVKLLRDNNGHLNLGDLWNTYTRTYPGTAKKKDLKLNKMSDIFHLYPTDFEIKSDSVYLSRGSSSTETPPTRSVPRQPLLGPTPIKPLWGSGTAARGGAAGWHSGLTSAKASIVNRLPDASSRRGFATSKQSKDKDYVSSASDSDSSDVISDTDSDIQIMGQDPPTAQPVLGHNSAAMKQTPASASSDFLSFDVPGTKPFFSKPELAHSQRPQLAPSQQPPPLQSLVFSSSNIANDFPPLMQLEAQASVPSMSHPQPIAGARDGAAMLGGQGRGQQLEALLQHQSHQRPVLGQQTPASPLLRGPGGWGTLNLLGSLSQTSPMPNPFFVTEPRQSLSGTSNESDSTASRLISSGGSVGTTPDPTPPRPSEPTWPPSYPKLGIAPGVPRERKQVNVKPIPFQRGRLTKEQLENLAQDCIETLVEAGDYVSPNRIVALLLQRFNVRDLRDLCVPGVNYPYHINCINEHERLLSKVNASIEAFVLSRSICTLYDLERSLVEYDVEKKDKFESLRLGPLQCLPVVYDKFKFPQEEKIPEITTADVLDVLQEYLTKKQKWTERLDMQEVMAYFVEYWHVPSAYSLGIRIRSLPLAAQVLKKSHRDAATTRKQVVNRCNSSVENEVRTAFHKVKANIFQIMQTEDGETLELRRHYAGMNAEAVMLELLDKYQMLLQLDMPVTKSERRRHTNIETVTKSFFTVMQQEPLARTLLHLSVCVGRLDLQEAAMELLAPKPQEDKGNSQEDGVAAEAQKSKQPPSKAALMEKMKRYVERCLSQGILSLSHLERIEEKLLEDFGFPTFFAMGFGHFLHFLLHDTAAKALMDECGGLSLGGSHQAQGNTHMTEVLEFLRQCKAADMTQEVDVDRALCQQFQVAEPRLLGFGSLRHLLEAAEKPGKHHARDYRILYETAFCGKPRQGIEGKREVGILGHQIRDAALACLQTCPLLEDLERWSHWSLVFEPQYGSLKDFLQKHGGIHTIHQEGGQKTITTDIVALETEPSHLLRLVSTTSPSHFQTAAKKADARAACGHLASLVVSNRGVEHTPLALLANHARSALFVLHTSSGDVPGAPGQAAPTVDPAIQFVLHCLLLLPLKLCVAVANQVLLEPLGQVVGSSRSKSLLLEASMVLSRHMGLAMAASTLPVRELARLGCLLGVQEWTRPLTDTFAFPPECVVVAAPPESILRDRLLGDEEEDNNEEEEEESEDSDEEEALSSSSFLSDVDVDDEQSEEKAKEAGREDKTDQDQTEILTVSESDEDSEEVGDGSEDEEEEEENEEAEKVGETMEEGEGEESKSSVEGEQGAGSDSNKVETEEDRCRRVINQIRRDEFGVGVELSEDGQRLMKVQQERLGRSLERLSRDLYSKDTHFVLELVQNADDNAYPDYLMAALTSSTYSDSPAVRFVITRDGVTVLNNECGFRENDVRALCDVGRSTKGKHKYGYIGQKGIGFKSVFRVTSRPEVHSNGFHLCFDVDSGPMGYILPHWCDDLEPNAGWMTKIVLPLKREMVQEARSLAARFNDIHPSLLLFLHRLRSIHIDNKVEGMELSMRRVDLGNNIVEIHHSHGDLDRWLVLKKQLDASAISLQAKSGVEVESTEIALAFPLMAQTSYNTTAPAKQPVFAFLPLRSYGFRFIIQGDFDVPSSREDVDRDSSWNQWLRNEVHTLFIEAFQVFQSHPEFEGLEALWSYLQFVPLEDEILDFFKPVASQILQKLRALPCMPCSASSKKGSELQWKLPSQTVMVQDALVQEVISPELLEQHLGLHYVHRAVASMLSPLLIRSLGVESITSDHLLQVGRSLLAVWGSHVADEEIVQIAKWLACVYRSMDDFHDNNALISTLRGMRVIPLSSGELVSLEEVTVFMLSEASSGTDKAAPGRRDPMCVLRQDLRLVHRGLTGTSDSEVNSQVWKLLHKLDIKQLSAHDIVHHHILPVLRSDLWQSKDRAVLVSYLVYIKEQRSRNNSLLNMEELKGVARVLTNHGIGQPAVDSIHFTPAYGVNIDLARLFPGYDWTLLDGQYIPPQSSIAEVQSWQDFFTQLGVADLPMVRQEEVYIKRQDLDKTPWTLFKEVWPATEEIYVIEDFVCEEFVHLVNHNTKSDTLDRQMRSLFELLDMNWDSKYSRFAVTQLRSGSTKMVLKDAIPSSFAIALQTLPWVLGLESTVERVENIVRLTEKEHLLKPSSLYIPEPTIKRLLAHTVAYLAVPASNTSSFSRFLHVRNCVEVTQVRDALVEWGRRDPKKPAEPAVFCSSQLHLRYVYQYLCDNLVAKDAQDLFHLNPVIFVPERTEEGASHQLVVGKMLGREEVWWGDGSGLFRKYRQTLLSYHSPLAQRHLLEHLYKDMQESFLRTARVQVEPALVDYAELLVHIASASSLSEEGVLADVLSIYTRIGHGLTAKYETSQTEYYQQQEQLKKVKATLGDKLVLATKSRLWVSPADRPLLADDTDMEKMFAGKEKVHFLVTDLPSSHQSRTSNRPPAGKGHKESSHIKTGHVLEFLALFDIKQLSEDVVKEEIPEMFVPFAAGQEYLRAIVPYVQRYLLSHYKSVQDAHHQEGVADRLKEMQFVKTKKLQVRYSLRNHPEACEIRDEKCVITHKYFYFHDKYVDSNLEVNKEVARFFSRNNAECMKDLRHFLQDLELRLKGQDHKELQTLLEEEEVYELPDSFVAWEVPKPVIPKPPTPPPPPPPPPVTSQLTEEDEEGEGPTLRAWPPTAPGQKREREGATVRKQGEGKPMGASIWPPPKAPEDQQRKRNLLPSNIHVELRSADSADVEATHLEAGRIGSLHAGPGPAHSGSGLDQSRFGPAQQETGPAPDAGPATVPHPGQVPAHPGPLGPSQGQRQGGWDSGTESGVSRDGGGENGVSWHDGSLAGADSRKRKSYELELETSDSKRPAPDSHSTPQDTIMALADMDAAGSLHTHQGQGFDKKGDNVAASALEALPGGQSRQSHSFVRRSGLPFRPRPDQLQLPVWTDLACETEYEELGRGKDLKLPTTVVLSESSSNVDIGRWAEQLVYDYLLQQKSMHDDIYEVIWTNDAEETGKPYDFEVICTSGDEAYTLYIEVKATQFSKKEVFEISPRQVRFASEHGERYHIYRIFNAGITEQVQLVRLVNVFHKMDNKEVRLLMVI